MSQGAAVEAGFRRPSLLGVGVIVWLASELMFFSGLFAAYFSLRASTADWPPEGVELDVPRTAVATVVLVASSLTLHLGVKRADHGHRRAANGWTIATLVLGALFVANQAAEWAVLDFSAGDHAYGSIFYLATGFHGLHVIGGLVLMAAVAGVTLGRSSQAPLAPVMEVTGYYWHFVDVVWVGVFATVYLIQ